MRFASVTSVAGVWIQADQADRRIAYTGVQPDDFWTQLGYDWYAGLSAAEGLIE